MLPVRRAPLAANAGAGATSLKVGADHIHKFKVGDPFYYDAGSGGFMINLIGGTKGDKKPYGNSAKGQVKTWGMICPT